MRDLHAAPKILVVDDDRMMRMQARHLLGKEGYRVIEAETGEEALQRFEETMPDLVLLDGVMPDMDGFECCRRLHDLPGAESVPVLMITGLDDRSSIDRAFAAGAEDFVTKPVHWDVLRHRLRRAIERSRLLDRLEQANRELERLATVDALTGLANRRQFDLVLAREWRRGARNERPLSLLLCDVDHFKQFNDAYGHLEGDRCLQRISERLAELARRSGDLAARYGGEEFALVLPETDQAGAAEMSEHILAEVRGLDQAHPSSTSGRVTLSIGVASVIPQAELSVTRLMAAADEALYEAKHAGRDTYRIRSLGAL
ncbi:MAG: PleD family two-component system response regulator [Lysobacteraceae bacterium]